MVGHLYMYMYMLLQYMYMYMYVPVHVRYIHYIIQRDEHIKVYFWINNTRDNNIPFTQSSWYIQ